MESAPCGRCASCKVFGAGNHPDYHVIIKEHIRYHDKTGKSKGIDLSINVLRPELIEPANRKASMGHGKVFVIEQADYMNAQAQNSILKTLEEPAGRTLIILLTDQPGALLPTIRSRCQMVRFAPLGKEVIRRELQVRGFEEGVAENAARLAEGSLGLAVKWIEDGVVAAGLELRGRLERIIQGGADIDLPDWFKQAGEAYAAKQLERDELSSKDQGNREGLALYLRLAAQLFREQLAQTSDPERLETFCSAIDGAAQAEQYLDANVNISLIFQQLAATLDSLFARSLARVR